jgi:alkanesulfonate monooxygenase
VATGAAGAIRQPAIAYLGLTWGEPPRAVNAKLRWIEELAAGLGKAPPRLGIRLHVISRDTAKEAWRVAGLDRASR